MPESYYIENTVKFYTIYSRPAPYICDCYVCRNAINMNQ